MIRIPYEPGQEVFIVFSSKREGYKENIVFQAVIDYVGITKETKEPLYTAKILKCVTNKKENIDSYTVYMHFRNANVNTGYRGLNSVYYPVFTSKEECIKWLKNQ